MTMPDCWTCDDEGWVRWDDDQGRNRGASFGRNVAKGPPLACPACNADGAYSLEEWSEDHLNPEPPTVGNERI